LNWCILIISTSAFFTQSKWPLIAKVGLSATMMVMLDLWMEPLSAKFGFWTWESGIIPLKNYLGWFITAVALQYVYWKSPFEKENPIGRSVFLIFLIFFMLSNALLRH
jgi:putative membrane protein